MATEKKTKTERGDKIVTPTVRVAFPHVHKPKTQGQFKDNKYHLTALLPKEREIELKPLKQAILAVARKAWPEIKYTELQVPFRDGEEKADNENFAGQVFFEMKSSFKPGIVGPDRKDLPEGENIYGGCWVRCSVIPFTYDNTKEVEVVDAKGKTKKEKRRVRGVSLGLQNIMKIKDDTPFGGGGDPAGDFSEVEDLEVEGSEVDEDETFDDVPAEPAKKGKKVVKEEEDEDGIV